MVGGEAGVGRQAQVGPCWLGAAIVKCVHTAGVHTIASSLYMAAPCSTQAAPFWLQLQRAAADARHLHARCAYVPYIRAQSRPCCPPTAGGESDPHTIGSGSEENDTSLGFERATRQTYRIHSKDLGQLRRCAAPVLWGHACLGRVVVWRAASVCSWFGGVQGAGASPPYRDLEPGLLVPAFPPLHPAPLQMCRLYVRQLPSPSTAGGGWYLDRIEVTGPGGEHWNFPCASWLGKSDAGGEGREGEWRDVLRALYLPCPALLLASAFVCCNGFWLGEQRRDAF